MRSPSILVVVCFILASGGLYSQELSGFQKTDAGDSHDQVRVFKPVELVFHGGERWVIARGRASWVKSKNAHLNLWARWAGRVKAEAEARKRMVSFLSGSGSAGRKWAKTFVSVPDDSIEAAHGGEGNGENLEFVVRGFLAAAKARMRETKSTVLVELSVARRVKGWMAGPVSLRAESFMSGLAKVEALARAGRLPPAGGVEIDGKDGRFHVGFGGAISDSGEAYREAALSLAENRARTGLLAHLRGEEVRSEGFIVTSFSEYYSGEKIHTDSTARVLERTKLLVRGALPPGVKKLEPITTADGIVFQLMVLAPIGVPDTPGPVDKIPVSRDPSEKIAIVRAEAPTRDGAIRRALQEAVMMVNGGMVKGSRLTKTKFHDAISDLNRAMSSQTSVEFRANESIYTRSHGMIKNYSILDEGLAARGEVFVRLKVTVPVFDPDDPRPGKRPVVATLPLRAKGSYRTLRGVSDGPRLAARLEAQLVEKLKAADRLTVLDRSFTKELGHEVDLMRTRIAAGQMQALELVKVGHLLGADYLVVGSLDRFEAASSETHLRASGRTVVVGAITLRLQWRLMNVATGEIVASKAFEGHWTSRDLAANQNPDLAGLDGESFALRSAARDIVRRVAQALKSHVERVRMAKLRRQAPLIADAAGELIILDARGVSYYIRVGDILEASSVKTVPVPGRSPLSVRSPVARIRVVRVDGGVVFAELLSGNRKALLPGTPCLPPPEGK